MNECIDLETKEKLDESRGRSRKRSPNLQKFTALSLCPDSTPLSPSFIPPRFHCKSGSFARIPFQFVNWSSFTSRSCSQFSLLALLAHSACSRSIILHSAVSYALFFSKLNFLCQICDNFRTNERNIDSLYRSYIWLSISNEFLS